MSGAIAIMVKTPGFSPVKTRLAVALGKEIAESFHLSAAKTVADVVQEACEMDQLTGYFAIAEQDAMNHDYWKKLPTLWQGEGCLGERMAHIYQTLLAKHDFVILVGADIPQMTTNNLLEASAWLLHNNQARLSFAPSEDGGFWLFGGNCPVAKNIWTDVVYSEKNTGKQFLNSVEQLGEVKILSTLRDVDELEDLPPLRQSLVELNKPLPAQNALIYFLDSVLPETIN